MAWQAGTVRELQARLDGLMFRDAHVLRRRLERSARRGWDRPGAPDELGGFISAVEAAELRVARRAASVPALTYPEELPITARRAEIAAMLREHQVLVLAGETGSGKTTQLPKICLETGRGIRGRIGHTQPRRLAARTVAERVAQELGTTIGDLVGWTVRFTDRAGENTLHRVMTDGILLAQIKGDPQLLAYDTLIIDEAHERSLNIDFLLGYLHRLLPRRPELKLIITSATIDPQRFAAHFGSDGAPVPVIEVSGRTYPVEIRYRPLIADTTSPERTAREKTAPERAVPERTAPERTLPEKPDRTSGGERDEPRDQPTAVCDAIDELCREGPGDVLVFLSGEREIRDTADALRARLEPAGSATTPSRSVEILPLYARLSVADQHRVFAPHPGRRVVLATNVAETSLTVPGIRYVVDAGTARISRYNVRRKVQRLPIEAISRASADQRAGRCGRLSAGICIRLYAEEDYAGRPAFTDPEVLRTSLAAVVLQMAALELGEVADFGFLDPPDRRSIADGVALLDELGALRPAAAGVPPKLTDVGRRMAALPVDPRLGRMIVEADRLGALREVIIIVAALSIQDPREYPAHALDSARAKHARFTDPTSDFLAWLNLWRYLREQQRELSSNAFRRLCAVDHLHYLRVREWQDLVAQLRQLAGGSGFRWNSDPAADHQVHTAVLSGLLSRIGMKDPAAGPAGQLFLGTRNSRFALFPGSGLARKPPRWVMAAELVETSRLFARTVARIEPEWVEPLAAHLVVRQYSEPRWDPDRGAVVATERVTLHGLPLVVGRRVDYARIEPVRCREIFLRSALVEGQWRTNHRFFAHNQALREAAGELEERTRRRGLVIDDDALQSFYDSRIPQGITSARHFDTWWKTERKRNPGALDLDPKSLLAAGVDTARDSDYPIRWDCDGGSLDLQYEFLPGSDFDGVTVEVPLGLLNRIRPAGFEWGVPGLREELVVALIRSLPKAIRRSFSPAPTYAAAVLPRLNPAAGESITSALSRELGARNGVRIDADDWAVEKLPGHLRMTFRVVGPDGAVLGHGKDLAALQADLTPALADLVTAGAGALEQAGLTSWPVLSAESGPSPAEIPRSHDQFRYGRIVRGYPALVDEDGRVALRVLTDATAAATAMWAGTRRLLLIACPPPTRAALAGLSNREKLALAAAPHAGGAELFEDCAAACIDVLIRTAGGPPWDSVGFDRLLGAVRAELPTRMTGVVFDVVKILTVAQEVDAALAANRTSPFPMAVADMRAQYDALLGPGFVTSSGVDRLKHLPRYLRGISRRLERLPTDPARDRARQTTVAQLGREYAEFREALPPTRRDEPDVVEIRWLLEELRISLFAQQLGTSGPVSEKRILRAMDDAEARGT